MIDHIDKKRKALGIDKARERVLMDMADRQALEGYKEQKFLVKQ
jgi:carbon-monoxide dehydrogenase catalytic subunit